MIDFASRFSYMLLSMSDIILAEIDLEDIGYPEEYALYI